MLIRRSTDIAPSEITPPEVFHRRRQLLGAALGAAVGRSAVGSLAAAATGFASTAAYAQGAPAAGGLAKLAAAPGPFSTIEKQTPYKLVTTYNNFYEFGTDKTDPASYAPAGLKTRPWSVVVEGEVKKPRAFSIDDILKLAPLQERVYRLRCVERWSMVVPWIGFPLADLIRQVEPTGNAKFVQFFTLNDPKQMPGLRSGVLDWPYTDGFRLDEAMHPLTMLVVGLYGEVLPNQNGAPLRVIVPWKYGFKQPKSIVRIRFVEKQPVGSWEHSQPSEYGFYSNVNPTRDHPRWSQATERRLGEEGLLNPPRKTLMFNGYADQVASLYTGMDLIKNY